MFKVSVVLRCKEKGVNNFGLFAIYAGYESSWQPESYGSGMSYESGGGSSKEMTLKKVYELALTAIAYLAFGIFVLQVIMCITTVCPFENQKNIVLIFFKIYYSIEIVLFLFTGQNTNGQYNGDGSTV